MPVPKQLSDEHEQQRIDACQSLVTRYRVMQISVLGPLMFLVFINELAEVLAKFGIAVKLFADNVKLYVKIMNDVDVCVLQHAIDACLLYTSPSPRD